MECVCCDRRSPETPEDSQLALIAIGCIARSWEKIARPLEVGLDAARAAICSQSAEIEVADRPRKALTVKVRCELGSDRICGAAEAGLKSLSDPAMPEARYRIVASLPLPPRPHAPPFAGNNALSDRGGAKFIEAGRAPRRLSMTQEVPQPGHQWRLHICRAPSARRVRGTTSAYRERSRLTITVAGE
jgi:hypothetical protein